jgi:hypothetical protein
LSKLVPLTNGPKNASSYVDLHRTRLDERDVIAVYHNDALRLLKCDRHHGVGRGNIGLCANESTSEVFICKLQVRERFAK